ncbi:MAG: synthase delta subunit [Candidatus Parcubacteria bacterium]|jgi:F0F1-type ATP synthase delta subunit
MKSQYAIAFLKSLETGMAVDAALVGLKATLAKKQHTKLLGGVLLEVLRVLEAQKGTKQAVVAVAKISDMKSLKTAIEAALSELGVAKETPVKEVVDETLIGGFVATFNYKEHDASYKKSLKSLYESIIK